MTKGLLAPDQSIGIPRSLAGRGVVNLCTCTGLAYACERRNAAYFPGLRPRRSATEDQTRSKTRSLFRTSARSLAEAPTAAEKAHTTAPTTYTALKG